MKKKLLVQNAQCCWSVMSTNSLCRVACKYVLSSTPDKMGVIYNLYT